MLSRIPLYPLDSKVNERGNLVVGGCDTVELATEFGTPLYIFDEHTLRSRINEFKTEFGGRYENITILYACKAFINRAFANMINEEGLGLDVVSEGELGIAHAAGFPMDRIYLHGNNKSAGELKLALELSIGRIVVDNFHELKMLNELAGDNKKKPDILLRLSPGVDPHTHKYITTGSIDSKFGFPLAQGEEAIVAAMSMENLNLIGLHFHIGSLLFEVEPYNDSIKYVLGLVAEMKQKHGFQLKEFDVGGGFAVQYTMDSPAPPLSYYAEAIINGIKSECRNHGLELPALVIEPGRSVVARAGVALYTAGVIKDIPGVRCYVSVDGGMSDNIRPALYGARQEAVIANKMTAEMDKKVTIAGKFCESGDVLITDIELPEVKSGDIIAVAGCGAYCLTEAMNYNASYKPAIVLVKEGNAHLIRRRETLEDLLRCDLI